LCFSFSDIDGTASSLQACYRGGKEVMLQQCADYLIAIDVACIWKYCQALFVIGAMKWGILFNTHFFKKCYTGFEKYDKI
jgi:hypothetical protein